MPFAQRTWCPFQRGHCVLSKEDNVSFPHRTLRHFQARQCVVSKVDNERLFSQAAHRAGEIAGGNSERRARCAGGWAACWRARIHCTLQQANAAVLLAAANPELPAHRPDRPPRAGRAWRASPAPLVRRADAHALDRHRRTDARHSL